MHNPANAILEELPDATDAQSESETSVIESPESTPVPSETPQSPSPTPAHLLSSLILLVLAVALELADLLTVTDTLLKQCS